MAFNGDGPHSKRQRLEETGHRNHEYGYGEEPRRKREDNNKPNHVLLFTIINPVYPITVEVLHAISHQSGQVQRIVIFKKNGVQAMVEFDSVESATRAKEALHGADIYSGCCTLKIDFAKPTKLNVYKNDSESWDYTTPAIGAHKDGQGNPRPAPLLAEPRYGAAPQPYAVAPAGGVQFGGAGAGAAHDRYEEGFNGPAAYAEPYVERYGLKSAAEFAGREALHPTPGTRPDCVAGAYVPGAALGQAPTGSAQGSVMMVYGLQPEKVNCDKLFNLFCLYGNVSKVKFLKTKEGCAMIQMGDSIAVERCLQNLNNVTIGNQDSTVKLQLGFSKQAFLSDVTNPYILPDKTPSFKDFTGSKNNRFLNPAMANKNRIQPPSKIVHFFNTPPDLTEETVNRVFIDHGIEPPTTVKLFPLKSERSSSGLIEFSCVGIAVQAIMECNHTALENNNGKFPYIMKLCFSSSRTIPSSFPAGTGGGSGSGSTSGSTGGQSANNGHAKMQQDSE